MAGKRVLRSLLLLFFSCVTPGNAVTDICAQGKLQSPVDIETKDSKECGSGIKPLLLSYKPAAKAVLFNNGQTVRIEVEDAARVSYIAQGGPLKGEYVLSQVHFHWGLNDAEGSEHTVNSNRYSMESHVVHYKKAYNTVEEALEHPDGLAVMAFFFQAQSSENLALKPLIEAVAEVTAATSKTDVNTEDVLHWILEATSKGNAYFAYLGSLTTTPCSENVSWMVFKNHLNISSDQLEVFRKVMSNGDAIAPNFRKTYPLNGRVIRSCMTDGQSGTQPFPELQLFFLPLLLYNLQKDI